MRFVSGWGGAPVTGALLATLLVGLGTAPTAASAQTPMDHRAMHGVAGESDGSLQEIGDAAFAAIQEVVQALSARPDTDWSSVDLEALRQHLIDMRRFTLEAEVVQREEIDGGLRVIVRGLNPEASASIRRALHAHAPILGEETGWSARVTDLDDATALEVSGDDPADADRIRALGYIGIMATGAHHQRHHWLIATGGQAHVHGG